MAEARHLVAIRKAEARLASTSETPRLDAEYLMAAAAGVPRSELWRLDTKTKSELFDHFVQLVERRVKGEPLAYILGNAEFFGRLFRVTPDVLIPRSDSETLIYAAKDLLPGARRVLDMGTGSGALLITALLELPDASGVAIDASLAALEVAQDNARLHELTSEGARFLHRDWTKDGWADDLAHFDLILCNPPYVEADVELDQSVREFEPAQALFAGRDGLDDYRVIIPQLGKLLAPGGVAILEIGATQALDVSEIAEKAGFRVKTRHDLANRPRVVILS